MGVSRSPYVGPHSLYSESLQQYTALTERGGDQDTPSLTPMGQATQWGVGAAQGPA